MWNIGKFLSETCYLERKLGRRYSTRLLNKVGRVVHTDALNSIFKE